MVSTTDIVEINEVHTRTNSVDTHVQRFLCSGIRI